MNAVALKTAPLAFAYRVVRSSRRRRISIEVRDAQVVVRAPTGVPENTLHQLVRDKRRWVDAKLAAQQAIIAQIPEYSYLTGSRMPWLGRDLTLVLGKGTNASVTRRDDQLHIILSSRSRLNPVEQTKRLVSQWYKETGLAVLERKTQALAQRMSLKCSRVAVRVTRSKWGHCTSRGAIQYNWQILLAPEPVVDYLVAHEVSHLRHQNHSGAFWQLVGSVCPDYAEQRAWLKRNGRCLVL